MTKSIVDYGTFAIGKRVKTPRGFKDEGYVHNEWGWVNDRALFCKKRNEKPPSCEGNLYSAKAPGASYLGVVVYFVMKNIYKLFNKTLSKGEIIYFLRLFTVIFPSLIFIFFFSKFLRNYIRDDFLTNALIIGYSIGTMSFTYGQMFAGHQLYAIFLFSGFMLIISGKKSRKPLLYYYFAGFLVSFSVLCEYPAFGAGVIISIYFIIMERKPKCILSYFGGGIIPAIALLLFHKLCFGSFFKTPYSYLENPQFIRDISPGILGINLPELEAFTGSFFSPFTGLFFFSPLLILIIPSIIYPIFHLFKKCETLKKIKGEVILSIIIFIYWTFFISSHSLWRGGWTVGPRYITGIVPFTLFAIALIFYHFEEHGFKFQRFILLPLTLLSIVITGLSSIISQGFSPAYYNPFIEMAIPFILNGYLPHNIGNIFGLKGFSSGIPFFLILLFFILYISFKGFEGRKKLLKGFLVIIITICLLIPISFIRTKDKKSIEEGDSFYKSIWEPKIEQIKD